MSLRLVGFNISARCTGDHTSVVINIEHSDDGIKANGKPEVHLPLSGPCVTSRFIAAAPSRPYESRYIFATVSNTGETGLDDVALVASLIVEKQGR